MTGGLRLPPPAPPDEKARKRLARIVVPAAADLVLLGDSNAAGWPGDLLEAALPGLRIFNFGLPGDRIQNTLWRLDEIETSHLRPRHVVVILGTNNLADGHSAEAVADGLMRVVDRIGNLWAEPEIILPTIARRGAGPLARSQERVGLNAILLATARPRLRVARTDQFLEAMGPIAFEEDGIHISRAGYGRLTHVLAELLGR